MEVISRITPVTQVVVQGQERPLDVRVTNTPTQVVVVQAGAAPGTGGSGGGQAAVTWTPPSALQVWMIPHSLSYKPQVTILDPDGKVVYGEVQHLDVNTLSVSFHVPFYGTAQLG